MNRDREWEIGDSQMITIKNGIISVPASTGIWMTQHQLADLFGCFVGKINANVRAILKTGVLNEAKVCRTYHYRNGSFVEQYNLEMITALAFRIRSYNAEIFRDWLMKKAVADIKPTSVFICKSWNNIQLN